MSYGLIQPNSPYNTGYVPALNNLSQQFNQQYAQSIYNPANNNFTGQTLTPASTDDTGFFGKGFSNTLGVIGLGLNGLVGIGSYLNGRKQLALAKQAMQQQQNNFNESYNAALKNYNTSLADRIMNRANFQTGNAHAYDDEIAANQMERGHTSPANSSYLTYKRSANV